MKKIKIYTDGACINNPGPGGWAAILEYKNIKKEIFGFAEDTTNNRMELTAIIEALKALTEPCEVEIYSDSQYVVNSINNNYKIKTNWDLWLVLKEEIAKHKCEFHWVKGHNGHPENERCDFLATQEAMKNKLNTQEQIKGGQHNAVYNN